MRFGIQKKIAGGYVLIVFLIVMSTTVIQIKTNQQMLAYTMTAHQYHQAERATFELFIAIRNEETAIRRYFLTKDPQFVAAFRNAQQQIAREKEVLEELLADDEEALSCLQERILPTAVYLDALLEDALANGQTEVTSYWLSFPGLTEDFIRAEKDLYFLLNQRHNKAMFAQHAYLQQSYRLWAFILILPAILASVLGLIIARGITGPLRKLMQGIEGLKSGAYRQIDGVRSKDELGALVNAFNQMADTIERNRLELQQSHQTVQQALEKMKEIDKLKTEVLNTVSHELRTPLTSILGFSELLLQNSALDAKAEKYVQMIHKETNRLSQLVNNFLDLQRIETGQVKFNRQMVNLRTVIEEVVESFQAQSFRHTIEIHLPNDLPPVETDPDQVARVLGNLLSNALKYSPRADKVEVEVERVAPDLIAIAVKDYGLGIPPAEQEAIFKPFYRVDHADRQGISGTGLGLAIAYQTARSLGGELRVDSQDGKGSTFTFTLPVTVSGA